MQNIEKWSLNNHLLEIKRLKTDNFDDSNLFKKCSERIGFGKNDTVVTIPVFFHRVHGVIGDDDQFYDRIYDLHEKLKSYKELFIKIDKGLERFDNKISDKLDPEWRKLESRGPINAENIIKVVENSQVLKRFTDSRHTKHVLNALKEYYSMYFEIVNNNIKPHEIKNILFHIVHWINVYTEQLLKDFDYAGINPKMLFYGTINKREAHFLYYLNCLGADVIYITTDEKSPFSDFDKENKLSSFSDSPRHLELKPFPTERINSGMATQAFSSSEELRETLHSDDSMFYRPWQLVDYAVRQVTIMSTYEEIGILAKEQALMRTGWEVGQNIVTVPNFFAKVLGVRKDINKYYDEVNALKKLPKTLFYDSLPISKKVTNHLKQEYYSVCDRDGIIDTEKLIESAFWPYKHLQMHVQKLIVASVKSFCAFKGIKRQKQYAVEEQKLIIFTSMMKLEPQALQLLQMFDYPKEVPKCIVFNNETNGELIFEDSILIYFLSSVGMDVIVFNPVGHNDIEIYLEDKMYQKHHLEEVAFNLPFKSLALFGKYIK